VVKAALAKHPHLRRCKVDARKRELVVYEAHVEGLEQLAALFPGREDALEREINRAPLMPVMRFVLGRVGVRRHPRPRREAIGVLGDLVLARSQHRDKVFVGRRPGGDGRLQEGAHHVEDEAAFEGLAEQRAALDELLGAQHPLARGVGRFQARVVEVCSQLLEVVDDVARAGPEVGGLGPPLGHVVREFPDLLPQRAAVVLAHGEDVLRVAAEHVELLLDRPKPGALWSARGQRLKQNRG
jgi:hypothetical protein